MSPATSKKKFSTIAQTRLKAKLEAEEKQAPVVLQRIGSCTLMASGATRAHVLTKTSPKDERDVMSYSGASRKDMIRLGSPVPFTGQARGIKQDLQSKYAQRSFLAANMFF
ncbi:uncharacterized protein JN550_012720 [Neoarthrinium moseri]|uniref:uncharacterized protein n=1 Tax=Neoarthrinium moseri TaxID=1658444 RepID=UPI001FDD14DB|nr:uncharacterized protein JN550_012720 [Neoarthrinium moseri]KAI1858355.1 hypothetical protein JN550_012720 [Neoarthrinium moseri]